MSVGIEAINFYGGVAFLDVRTLFQARKLDLRRFDNLMMVRKSVGLPCEDPVTNAVNAAKPIIDALSDAEKKRIELLITSSESGLDFGKAIGTYVHDLLGLSRNCRILETKQACYAGTASMQLAAGLIAANASPGAKALVISTDTARATLQSSLEVGTGSGNETPMSYAEPSQGTGAVAMIVSDRPDIFELDFGANGFCSYEVMDTCRPLPEIETGDPDLSLFSYLDCLAGSFQSYCERVEGADFGKTFDYLAFHTPFAGLVKGAHRNMMRKSKVAPAEIEADFQRRMTPSLKYCVQVGNVYAATVFLALCGLIDHAQLTEPGRVGVFSYGSGCSSEFYSGVITRSSQQKLAGMQIGRKLEGRVGLTIEQYERLLVLNREWVFGIKDKQADHASYADLYDRQMLGRGLLVLKEVKGYHRTYAWS